MPGYTFLKYNLGSKYGKTTIKHDVDEITFYNITLTEINFQVVDDFFLTYGHQFKSLFFSYVICENLRIEKLLLNLIANRCPNIIKIEFSNCKFAAHHTDEIITIVKNYTKLQHLKLFEPPSNEADYLKIIASVEDHKYLRELTLNPATETEAAKQACSSLTSYLERNKKSAIQSGIEATETIYVSVSNTAEPQDKATLIDNCQRLLGAKKLLKSLPEHPDVKAAEEKINTLLKTLKAKVREILIIELKGSRAETLEIPGAGFTEHEDNIIREIVTAHILANPNLRRIILAEEITALFPFEYDPYYRTLNTIAFLGKTLLECHSRVTIIDGLPDQRTVKHSQDYFGDLNKALERNRKWEEHQEAQNEGLRQLDKLALGSTPRALQTLFLIAVKLETAGFPNPSQAKQFLNTAESHFNDDIFNGLEEGSPEDQMKKHDELRQLFVEVSEFILNSSGYTFDRFNRFSKLILPLIERYVANHFIKLIKLCHGDNLSAEKHVMQMQLGFYQIGECVGKLYQNPDGNQQSIKIFQRAVRLSFNAYIATTEIEYRNNSIYCQINDIFRFSSHSEFRFAFNGLHATTQLPSLPFPSYFIGHAKQLNSLEYKIKYFEDCLEHAKKQKLFYRLRAHQRLFGYLVGISFVERTKDYWLSYEAETQVGANFDNPLRDKFIKLYFEKYITDLAIDVEGNNLNACHIYLGNFLDFIVRRYPAYAAKVLNTYAMLVAQMNLSAAEVNTRIDDLKATVSRLGWRSRDDAKTGLIQIIIQLAKENNFGLMPYAIELARELGLQRLIENFIRSTEKPQQTKIIGALFKIYQTKIILIAEHEKATDLLFSVRKAKNLADLLHALEKSENNHIVPTAVRSLVNTNSASLNQIKNDIAIIPMDLQTLSEETEKLARNAPPVARQNAFVLNLLAPPPPAAAAPIKAAPPHEHHSEEIDGPVESISPKTNKQNPDQAPVVPAAAQTLSPAPVATPTPSAPTCPPAAEPKSDDLIINSYARFFTPVAQFTPEALPVIYTDSQSVEADFARVVPIPAGDPYITPVLPSVPETEPSAQTRVYEIPPP